jgi:hypothetical protein
MRIQTFSWNLDPEILLIENRQMRLLKPSKKDIQAPGKASSPTENLET